jgi:hypothetical protein
MALGKAVPASSDLGVFCLESWSGDLRNRDTVRPLLEVLEAQAKLKFVHRTIDSREQLIDYLVRWQALGAYRVAYLACHGSTGEIHIGGETLSLDKLGMLLAEEGVDLRDRALYLGGCAVMGVGRNVTSKLRERTRLACVCGYAGDEGVDWLESAAFELLVFKALAFGGHRQHHYNLRDLSVDHRQLARHLKFKVDPKAPSKRRAARGA